MAITIKIEYKNKNIKKIDFSIEEITNKIMNEIIKQHNIIYDIGVFVLLVSNYKIKKINKQFRQIDRSTDVLSFPMFEFDKIADFKNATSFINNNELFIGDTIISVDKCLAQAAKYNHSIKREFSFLITHSFLHLIGYDHIKNNDEKKMISMQNNILSNLGIYR